MATTRCVADLYWMRAVVYYGGQRLKTTSRRRTTTSSTRLLDLVTTLDPRFNVAYRFGAIFLAEAYPSGPGRPDQAIALLQRGIDRTGRWEYMHDIGFVYYWWLRITRRPRSGSTARRKCPGRRRG